MSVRIACGEKLGQVQTSIHGVSFARELTLTEITTQSGVVRKFPKIYTNFPKFPWIFLKFIQIFLNFPKIYTNFPKFPWIFLKFIQIFLNFPKICINFPKFQHFLGEGSSGNPCSQTYAGKTPHSEPEVKSLTNKVSSISKRVALFLSLHSYSQIMLLPYGHSTDVPKEYDDLVSN